MLKKIKSQFETVKHRSLKAAVSLSLLFPSLSYASGSSGMPWEDPLSKIVDSVTGPIAFGVAVLGIVVAGLTLVFGGQLDGFIQKIAILALVVSLIVLATNVLSSLFGVSSTLVAMNAMNALPTA
ncbi:TrbC/VirB2 family protein [Vibrio parahaemolyticus]|uniref:TrbC/VirB2 family protein n=1 Tax=Vibrio parahaemolyticus TaxID=670 RepID=UPI00046FD8AF|nr:TrbC/VirB2 family protein [Vibrio parahaemolyticus]EHC7291043.1 conjugal transfer protein TrbC [Vibrio parahaemolyticus]EJE4149872.1 TrbC/VirB2 family protein [Vibrio parahaemolyticus]MBY4654370.1 TrbC/VirB2 family protein [Vibrio parahaemolyticus]MCR9855879.1 TrbC/VirB2 family protein [Vibrio parahaemolyticus]MDF4896474.1 TrbC/VirB2 family protein [Vibrio parahaemolyticus]